MQLATSHTPSPLEAKQRLRLRRFKLAALSYAMAAVLLAAGWMVGTLPDSAVLGIATTFVAINLGTYVAIRSGFNLRFRDPSLTRFQIMAAITVLMYIVYKLDSDRHIVASVCFLVFLFGTFRLNAREYRLVTLYTLAAYALVINLLMHLRPHAITDVPGEWMSWLIFAGFLQCFAIIGAQMNAVRRKLRDSEARFRSLTEMSSDFYWESDADHRLTMRSASSDHSVESVFAKAEALGKRRWDTAYLSPDESAWQAHREALDAHLPFRDFTFSRLADEGSEHHISISGDPVFDAAGEFVGYRGVGSDISGRKHAEEELSEQRAIFSTILASASEAIFAKDLDGKYRFMNEAGAQILGYRANDVIGRTDADLLPPHLASAFRKVDERVIATGETHVNEPVGVARDKRRALIARKTPWRNHLGEIVGVIGVSTDITERKDAEDALRKTIAFSESLSEAMPLPVFHKDSSGRYTGCNSAFARFIGKAKSEIVGKTVFEVSPQHFANTYKDKDLELLNDPIGTQTYESRVAHADGSARDVIFHKARLTDSDGNPIGIVGIITDITELKQIHARQVSLEAQLRESQKMEALGTLAGGVAHDFNNIVTAIIGNAELARQDIGSAHPAIVSLEEIRKASRRAKDLVQQILAFGRRQGIDRKVIALAPVVEESARLLRASMLGAVSLNISCVDEAPLVLADPTQIQQVLLNLGGNAWHAVEGQGSAGIIEVLLETNVRSGKRFATLTVRDNGHGMDEATRSRIFEPFFTTKPEGKGTGLGLSVVHSILADHEAIIEISSAPGKGATFTVHFPEAQLPEQDVAASGPQVAEVHGQGAHVLYIDDDEAIVFLIARLLERQGYRVSGYTEAKVALEAVRAKPSEFDLVVSDYSMPGMSGIDVARAIRDIRADLPVAVASGYITDELRKEAPAAGVLELIYKPDTIEDFCVVVARLAKTARAKSVRSLG